MAETSPRAGFRPLARQKRTSAAQRQGSAGLAALSLIRSLKILPLLLFRRTGHGTIQLPASRHALFRRDDFALQEPVNLLSFSRCDCVN
jgi:hypothetical protein